MKKLEEYYKDQEETYFIRTIKIYGSIIFYNIVVINSGEIVMFKNKKSIEDFLDSNIIKITKEDWLSKIDEKVSRK